jgi:hypothetical protein
MTEHKTMNTIIHDAFRRDLGRFDAALGGFPAGSKERADQLFQAWDNLAFQLHHHHRDEETIFWPTMLELGADGPLVEALQTEHAAMLTALDAASSSMAAFHSDPSAELAGHARADIDRLREVLVEHLDHEERDLDPFGTSHAKTSQMKAAQVAVRKAHKGGTGTFFAWLLDSDDPSTLTNLRREIPAPVLLAIARFGGRGYRSKVAPTWA